MLNYIWAFMILIGVVYGAFTGKMAEVTSAALDSAGDAVSLCITMIGVMALWVGLMEIAQKSGLIAKLTRGIQPFISFLFPRIPKGHPAREYIATNLIANVLGLGWACTPAGLKAMEELAKLEAERGTPGYTLDGAAKNSGVETTGVHDGGSVGKGRRKQECVASNEMCTFLILNISSLQLIPVNMIAYRSQYGSVNPAGIIAPAIVATFVSTAVAVVYCKGKDRRRRV
ncbi:MAG: nucleoside recognition protein [Lachnospiraceae bacterium]|nr:nucleoside recognition protein [Lachnospiraceae bacterium]